MLVFITRRLAQSLLVMLLVAFIAFVLFNFIGDPISNMLSSDASPAEREQIRQALGLNDAFYVQFVRFVGNLLRGELGISYRLGLPVRTC